MMDAGDPERVEDCIKGPQRMLGFLKNYLPTYPFAVVVCGC